MQFEDNLFVGAASAALTGDVTDFEYELRKAEVDIATGSGSADVHVQLDHLTSFYNALSELHAQLLEQVEAAQMSASAVHAMNAGGAVPGVQRAWDAMAQSAGSQATFTASLTANLQAVDGMVIVHMGSVQHNAQQYARTENLAVAALGHAATSEDQSASQPLTAPPRHAPANNSSGIGGR